MSSSAATESHAAPSPATSTSTTNPSTGGPRKTLTDMPPEILFLIAEHQDLEEHKVIRNRRNRLAIPLACRSLCRHILPWLYTNNVIVAYRRDEHTKKTCISPPYALLWGCRFGCLRTVEASLAAIDRMSHLPMVSKADIVNYHLSDGLGPWSRLERGIMEYDAGWGTVLHHACLGGNTVIIELLMSVGAKLGTIDMQGYSLFGYCMNGNMVRFLIDKGFSIDTEDRERGLTALNQIIRWAAEYKCQPPPRNVLGGDGALLSSHQNWDPTDSIQTMTDIAGPGSWRDRFPARAWVSNPLEAAVKGRLTDIVKHLLIAGLSPNIDPQHLLLADAMMGLRVDYDIVNMLLDANAMVRPQRPNSCAAYMLPLGLLDCRSSWISVANGQSTRFVNDKRAKKDCDIARRILERCPLSEITPELLTFYVDYKDRPDIRDVLHEARANHVQSWSPDGK